MPPSRISREEVLKFDTFLFDADGVLWTGSSAIPGAVEFVKTLTSSGKRVYIISNNSTKSLDHYMSKIKKLGFEGVDSDHVITPAFVLAAYFRDHPEYHGQKVYLMGTENLKKMLETIGKVECFGTGPDHFSDHSKCDFMFSLDLSVIPKAVVCSYDAHLSYPKIMRAATYLKRKEIDFFVTNEDYTFPGPDPNMVIPGSGCTSAAVRAVSGRTPTIIGKPHKPIADFLKKNEQIDPSRTVMFGDRLDTDILFANNNGFKSCLMLTGIHSLDDVAKAEQRGETSLIPTHVFSFTDH